MRVGGYYHYTIIRRPQRLVPPMRRKHNCNTCGVSSPMF